MKNTISIRIDRDDVIAMRTRGAELFLKSNPKFNGLYLSDRFLFKKMVEFYLHA